MKNDYVLKIEQDDDPVNPWEDYDHLSKIVHWHRRGFFGEDIRGREEEWFEEHERAGDIILPLYLYEHSGQTISLGRDYPFNDPWDSGQVGFVYISKEDAKKEYGSFRYWRKRAAECIHAEIKELDQYLTGDAWGYTITDKEGDVVESCWGFYGYDYCKEEAERMLKYLEDKQPSLPGIAV